LKNLALAAMALLTLAGSASVPAMAAGISTVNDQTFATSVLKSPRPVLVDFYADWCGPCRRMGPVVESLSQQHPDIKFVRVNVDDSPATARRYGITSIPTFAVFKNGRVVGATTGYMPPQDLEATISRALSRRTASK
jgi:thioredoxin 1